MWDFHSNGQSGNDELMPSVSLPQHTHIQHCRFSMAPACFSQFWLLMPSAVLLQSLTAHKHVHTNSHTCIHASGSPTLSALQTAHCTDFHVSPHLGTSSYHSLTPLNHALSLRHAWEEAGMWGRNKGLQILYFLRGFCHAGDVRGAVSFPFSWGAVTMTMAILCWCPPAK